MRKKRHADIEAALEAQQADCRGAFCAGLCRGGGISERKNARAQDALDAQLPRGRKRLRSLTDRLEALTGKKLARAERAELEALKRPRPRPRGQPYSRRRAAAAMKNAAAADRGSDCADKGAFRPPGETGALGRRGKVYDTVSGQVSRRVKISL